MNTVNDQAVDDQEPNGTAADATSGATADEYKHRLKQALGVMQGMRSRLTELEDASHEPIAVVGIGCRFPGGITGPDSYWQVLHDGVDAVSEIPEDRWNIDEHFDLDRSAPGKTYTRWGGYLDQIDQFDPSVFGILPREVPSIDPQHRLFLEVAWEALEHGGHAPDRLRGSRTGVFVGLTLNEYLVLESQQMSKRDITGYHVSGSAPNVAAGRLSYLLGLQGPSLAVDTACSSSLVAVHLACQSLRTGDADMALAGGANALIIPDTFISFSKWGMMSADGRCKTFDATADGMVRSEGCGVVVLKRMSDAVADGDSILALIRGSAVNQDGASGGLSVPNGLAQQAVIRSALDNARVEASEIGYVEAHGTGTALGDPIQIEVLARVVAAGRSSDEPLIVGSAKTNLGHLESASGVAGLIKAILSLQHDEISPTLHFSEPSPHIPWDLAPIQVVTEPTTWSEATPGKLAGVSSFGFSGTNAHVVLQGPPDLDATLDAATVDAAPERTHHVLTLSAKSPDALAALATEFVDRLSTGLDATLADICFTANTGRSRFRHRLAVVTTSKENLQSGLERLIAGSTAAGAHRGESPHVATKPVFLFTGQGSQHVGMGRDLYDNEPVFRTQLDRCAEILEAHIDIPLLDVLYPVDASTGSVDPINETTYTQPALFAFEYALAKLWQSLGVEPVAVAGHSVGEYVAACLAGVFSLDGALELVAARGRLMGALPVGGSMLAIRTDEATVIQLLAEQGGDVSIAAINGPANVVVSGDADAVAAIARRCDERDITATALTVSHAFHSSLMEPVLDEFEALASTITYHRPQLPIISNVSGRVADVDKLMTPAYWRDHIRKPVRFNDAIRWLHDHDHRVFLEVGPHPVLSGMVAESLADADIVTVPSLRRQHDDERQILSGLGALHVAGVDVDWRQLDHGRHRRRVPLPTYPFQRQRYWFKASDRAEATAPQHHGGHPLLGSRVRSPLHPDITYISTLHPDRVPFLADHTINGRVVLPATAYVDLMFAAAADAWPGRDVSLTNLLLEHPVEFADRPVELHVITSEPVDEVSTVRVFSYDDDNDAWALHADGQLQFVATGATTRPPTSLSDARERCRTEVSVEVNYSALLDRGIEFGPSFRGVERLWSGDREALGEIVTPASLLDHTRAHQLHPAQLDAGLQPLSLVVPDDGHTYVPMGLGSCHVNGPLPERFVSHARLSTGVHEGSASNVLYGDVQLFSEDGALLVDITGIMLYRLDTGPLVTAAGPLIEVDWVEQRLSTDIGAPAAGTWVVLADTGGVAAGLTKQLESAGVSVLSIVVDGDMATDDRLRKALTGIDGPVAGIVHLLACDLAADTAVDVAPFDDGRHRPLRSLLALVQAMSSRRLDPAPRLWVVTRGAQSTSPGDPANTAARALVGLAQAVNQEHPEWHTTSIDFNRHPQVGERDALWAELCSGSEESVLALRNGRRLAARLVRRGADRSIATAAHDGTGNDSATTDTHLTMLRRGAITDLTFEPFERRSPGSGEVVIDVRATAMNFRDVLRALDMYPDPEIVFGDECAGVVTEVGASVTRFQPGDAVFGLASDSFATRVVAAADLLIAKPATLSFEAVAALPIAFVTAHDALLRHGRLAAGEHVLIHSAAGGVGQAAVQLALRAGAEVWGTAGSVEKRDLLRSMGVQHVLDSRTTAFADEILEQTDGRGVDVVLNSLSGEFVDRSVAALAESGRFLEMGKIEVWDADRMADVRPDVEFHTIFPDKLYREHPDIVRALLTEVVAQIADGTLAPLPVQTFPLGEVEDAFRFMAQARHVGKIAVTQRADPPATIAEQIRPDAAYLISGGFGGIGIQLAQWLAEQGARHLTLVGRRGAPLSAQPLLAELDDQGVTVTAIAADVADSDAVDRVVATVKASGLPLGGIFHTAGVNADAVLEQQTWESFETVLAPKLTGCWNLHHSTVDWPPEMFVLFSSASSLLGFAGQANYAAANAALDGFAQWRASLGLATTSVNWGAWDRVGMTAVLSDADRDRLRRSGFGSIPAQHAFELLGNMSTMGSKQVGVLPIVDEHFTAATPFTRSLVAGPTGRSRTATPDAPTASAPPHLLAEYVAAPPAQRARILRLHVVDVARTIFGLGDDQPIPDRQPLGEIGMDSLAAVELRNALCEAVAVALPATLMFDYPTVDSLVTYLHQRLDAAEEPAATAPSRPKSAPAAAEIAIDEVDGLSEDDAELLLLQELDQLEDGRA